MILFSIPNHFYHRLDGNHQPLPNTGMRIKTEPQRRPQPQPHRCGCGNAASTCIRWLEIPSLSFHHKPQRNRSANRNRIPVFGITIHKIMRPLQKNILFVWVASRALDVDKSLMKVLCSGKPGAVSMLVSSEVVFHWVLLKTSVFQPTFLVVSRQNLPKFEADFNGKQPQKTQTLKLRHVYLNTVLSSNSYQHLRLCSPPQKNVFFWRGRAWFYGW